MKRGYFLLAAAITVAIASGCMSQSEAQAEPVKEVITVSHSKPVRDPYLDFDLEHLSCIITPEPQETSEVTPAPAEEAEPEEIPTEEETGQTGENNELIDLGEWLITFYCPCETCCGPWATGCTASGVMATEWHTVATDQFDFGTQLYIEGLGYFVVEDRGVEGAHADVFVNDHQYALELGEQHREVYLVGEKEIE